MTTPTRQAPETSFTESAARDPERRVGGITPALIIIILIIIYLIYFKKL